MEYQVHHQDGLLFDDPSTSGGGSKDEQPPSALERDLADMLRTLFEALNPLGISTDIIEIKGE